MVVWIAFCALTLCRSAGALHSRRGHALLGAPRRARDAARLPALAMQPAEWIETFEKTSPWMSPTGGDGIPGFFNALDVTKYISSPYLENQPIIVRVGLGLLVVDVIPLAIDILLFRWLLQKFGGDDAAGGGDEVLVAAALDDLLQASEAVAFFEKGRGQSLVARRSKALLSVFYSDFFGKGFASGLPPDVLLFQLFTKLGPAFEAVAIALVENRLIRSVEVSSFLSSSIALPTVDGALGLLDAACSTEQSFAKLDPRSASVRAVTPMGTIYTATATPATGGGKLVVGLKPSAVDLKTCLVDLYVIRRLVQSFGSYPATSAKAQLVLPLIDAAVTSALQLNRIFAKAEPAATLAVIQHDAINL